MEALTAYDITAERKSIYSDLEEIRNLGIDIMGEQRGKTYFYYVAVSEPFFGWLFGLGDKVQILGPDTVVDKMKEMLQKVSCRYLEEM